MNRETEIVLDAYLDLEEPERKKFRKTLENLMDTEYSLMEMMDNSGGNYNSAVSYSDIVVAELFLNAIEHIEWDVIENIDWHIIDEREITTAEELKEILQ
jgi:hypothetical protein